MSQKRYEAIRPYVTTTNGPDGEVIDFHINYERRGQQHTHRLDAIREGFEVHGSDDFNIAVWDVRLVSWDWMDKPVGDDVSVAEIARKLT